MEINGRSGKLVRDNIPAIMLADGETPEVIQLADVETLRDALKGKLQEEVGELLRAPDSAEEFADVHEVLLALAATYGLASSHIESVRVRKLAQKGGFAERKFLYFSQNINGEVSISQPGATYAAAERDFFGG